MIREEKADMRKSKRMIALVLVLVMVLTSITFSSGSSQAEGDSNSGNDIVLNFPESEKNNVDLSNYGLSVKNKSDGKEVADVTSYATATDAKGNKNKIVIADRKLTNGTTYVAEVTSSNWTGYKYKAEFKYDGKGQSVALDKYLTKVTITLNQEYVDIKVSGLSDSDKISIGTDKKTITIENEAGIKANSEVAKITATKTVDGVKLACEGSISLGRSEIGNIVLNAKQYIVALNIDTKDIEVKYSKHDSQQYTGISDKIAFDKGETYDVILTSRVADKVIDSISGLTVVSKQTNKDGYHQVTATIAENAIENDIVTIAADIREINSTDVKNVSIKTNPANLFPEIPFEVSYDVEMNNGVSPELFKKKFKNVKPSLNIVTSSNDPILNVVDDNNKYVISGSNIDISNKKDAKNDQLSIKYEFGDILSKEITKNITINDLVYDIDYTLDDNLPMYPVNNGKKIYYRGENARLKLLTKGGYSQYRYKTGENNSSFSTFEEIIKNGENATIPVGSSTTFQMKNNNKDSLEFGVSSAITVVKDAVAPTLTDVINKTLNKKVDGTYVFPEDTDVDIKVMAQDDPSGSGISKIVWTTAGEQLSEEKIRALETKSTSSEVSVRSCADKSKKINTITFYAIDNVGNISNISDPLTYKVQFDAEKPTISCDKIDDKIAYKKQEELNKSEEGYYYVNILLSDDISIGNYTITVKEGNSVVNYSDDYVDGANKKDAQKVIVPVKIDKPDAKYSMNVTVKDKSNHETNTTYTLVVDSTVPVIDEDNEDYLYAEPVAMDTSVLKSKNEKNLYENYDTDYTAYNSSSEIKWKYTETNPSSATAGFGDHQTIELGDSTSGTTKIKFGGEDYYTIKRDNVPVIVTDKAENKSEFTLKRDKENTTDAGNIVYTNIPVNFGTPEFEVVSKESTTIKRSGDKISATVQVNANINYLVKDFVKATLSKDGTDDVIVTAPTIKLDGNAEDTSTIIKLTFDTKNLNDNKYKLLDGIYKLNVYYYDIGSGKIKKETSDNYIYDTTAPVIESDVDSINGTITYKLTETNPDFGNFGIILESFNNDKKENKNALAAENVILNNNSKEPVNFSDLSVLLNNKKYWEQSNDSSVYTAKIQFKTEGDYHIEITAKDTAGNESSNKEGLSEIIYDVTAPTINAENITVNATYNPNTPGYKYSDYGYFDQKIVKVQVVAEELVGEAKVECVKTDKNNKSTKISGTKTSVSGSKFTYSFDIEADFKGSLTFNTSDTNNNKSNSAAKLAKGIIVESQNKHNKTSSVNIETLNKPNSDAKGQIYNKPVNIKLSALDSYSGLHDVSYTVKNGKTTTSVGKSETFSGKKIMTDEWSNNLVLNAALNSQLEGDEITVTLTGHDNTGREVTAKPSSYNIDITKPNIKVEYTGTSSNREFYQRRNVKITIVEHNFDSERTKVYINKNGRNVVIPVSFTANGEKDTLEGTYTFVGGTGDALSDGDYSNIRVESTDLAGNKQVQTKADRFTIDGTKPTMTITYDNNNAKSGSYYGEARTATITVNEHNFALEDITVDAKKDGTPISISGWSGSGDTHVATVSFNTDGNYTISASCKDRANNQGNSIETQAFTVDLTKPEVVIEGVTNGTSYTGSVLPVVKVTDTNYDENGVVVTLVGGKNGVKESGFSKSSIANGQTYSFYDLERNQKSDDIYKLTVKAVDKAGHETTQTISYRVNRFGSIYSLSKALESAVDSYYAAASDKFAIYEQNVDEVKTSTVSYTIDNEIVNLEEGKDYTVKHSEDRTGWNQYEYVLSKDSFAKEGVYTVSVSSEDTVGNISDNKSKGVNMEFCIDNTAPVCIVSGVEEGQKIERDASANIGIEAYDNIMFATMKVELNGEQIKSEADLQDGKLSFTVSPTSGEQTLKVTCYDAAGNEKIEEVHFTFDVSILNSHLWIVLVIIAICIVLLGMVIIIVNKRRRANQ